MSEYSDAINLHYGKTDLCSQILESLRNAGKNPEKLSREDIATFEEFHIGGREETRNLARIAGISSGMKVLDVGCGIGGPARTLAAEFGCRVTGLDLTEEYCLAADMLTERVGLSDLVNFKNGSALEIPFDNDSFDAVWLQHASMNIEDKAKLYSEIYRVLRPGGRFAMHEIMAGKTKQLFFPVFWAEEPRLSFLISPAQNRQILKNCGFEEMMWEDTTERSIEWFQNLKTKMEKEGMPQLGLNVIVDRNVPAKAANVTRNMVEGRIVVTEACFVKARP